MRITKRNCFEDPCARLFENGNLCFSAVTVKRLSRNKNLKDHVFIDYEDGNLVFTPTDSEEGYKLTGIPYGMRICCRELKHYLPIGEQLPVVIGTDGTFSILCVKKKE